MRRTGVFALSLFLAVPMFAFDPGASASRIIVIPDVETSEAPALRALCRSVADSLREEGREATVFEGDPLTIDRSDVAYIVHVGGVESAREHDLFGTGIVGRGSVGADIDLVRSRAYARVDLLHPATLEVMRSFELDESSVRPLITSINIGDRYGYLRIPIWFGRRSSEQAAARSLGERIAARLLAEETAE